MKTETKTGYDAKMRRRNIPPKKDKRRKDPATLKKESLSALLENRNRWRDASWRHASYSQIVLKKRKQLHDLLKAARLDIKKLTKKSDNLRRLSAMTGIRIVILKLKRKRLHNELKATREALRLACRSSIHAPIYYKRKAGYWG